MATAPQPEPLVGIFVGGASRRMGQAKGLLAAPDRSGRNLVQRLADEAAAALPHAEIVLVGQRAEYSDLELAVLPDEISESGPLGGLVALLSHGEAQGCSSVIALACDLPYVGASLIRRVAGEEPSAEVCCPHLDGRYQPMAARYSVSLLAPFRAALGAKKLALQPLVRDAQTHMLELTEAERAALTDWDTPEDVTPSDQ